MKCRCHEDSLGLMFSQIGHLCVVRARKVFGAYDLKPGQVQILFVLGQGGGLSQRELAEYLNLTPPSITAAIQKMERQGYIQRKPDEKDQRIMRLSLTEKSRECLKYIRDVQREMDRILQKGLSEEEVKILKKILSGIWDNLMEFVDCSDEKLSERNCVIWENC